MSLMTLIVSALTADTAEAGLLILDNGPAARAEVERVGG